MTSINLQIPLADYGPLATVSALNGLDPSRWIKSRVLAATAAPAEPPAEQDPAPAQYDDADFLPGAGRVISDPAELAKSAAILDGAHV